MLLSSSSYGRHLYRWSVTLWRRSRRFSRRCWSLFSAIIIPLLILERQVALSAVMACQLSSIPNSLRSSLAQSFQRFFGLPRDRVPCANSLKSSCLGILSFFILHTCPSHLRRFDLIIVSIVVHLARASTSVFVMWCHHLIFKSRRRERWWKASSIRTCLARDGQVSEP